MEEVKLKQQYKYWGSYVVWARKERVDQIVYTLNRKAYLMTVSKKLKFNNTLKSGTMTFLVGPEKDKFVGVCLEFDLVVKADTFEKAKKEIYDYAKLWLNNARANKLSEEVLNRPAPRKYWEIHKHLVEMDREKLDVEKKGSDLSGARILNMAKLQFPYNLNFNFI